MKTARLGSILLLALAAVSAARVAAQQPTETTPPAVTDPLAKELERCKQLNEKAAADEQCQAAYQQNRQLFFQHGGTYHPTPVDMFPKDSTGPWTIDKKPDPAPAEK